MGRELSAFSSELGRHAGRGPAMPETPRQSSSPQSCKLSAISCQRSAFGLAFGCWLGGLTGTPGSAESWQAAEKRSISSTEKTFKNGLIGPKKSPHVSSDFEVTEVVEAAERICGNGVSGGLSVFRLPNQNSNQVFSSLWEFSVPSAASVSSKPGGNAATPGTQSAIFGFPRCRCVSPVNQLFRGAPCA